MKRVIILTVALMMLAGAAYAQCGGASIGLYNDDVHYDCSAHGVGFYPVEMWVWCKPDPAIGMICAEFMVSYPPIVIQSTVTKNVPIISVDMGDYPSGYSVCFINCYYDWIWPGHQLLYVTDAATQAQCCVVKHPDPNIECVQMADCTPGYPTYCVYACPCLWLNLEENPCGDPCPTEETSWGAIKELIK
jgi:hypothetical protein